MTIERIGSPLDRTELDKINKNFENLSKIDYKIMRDFLNADPGKLTPSLNGVEKPTGDLDIRNLNDFGVNFTPGINGVIYQTSVYAAQSGALGIGLAEQDRNDVASSELYLKVIDVRQGWNTVVLNFPVSQGKGYTLFKRNMESDISLAVRVISSWANHQFINGGLRMNIGKYLNDTNTYSVYNGLFEIQLITSLAQVYKIANDSVIPPQQFYVGDNPPQDAQFWFKPVGGGS